MSLSPPAFPFKLIMQSLYTETQAIFKQLPVRLIRY